MNKLLTKIVGATLGLTMAIGVGVAVANSSKSVEPAKAATNNVTFSASSDSGDGSITKTGITVSMSTMNRSQQDNFRANASSDINVSSTVGNIQTVAFTCTGSGTNNYGPGKMDVKSGSLGSYSYSGTVGTWTGDAASFVMRTTAQVRITQIVVTHTVASVTQATSMTITPTTATTVYAGDSVTFTTSLSGGSGLYEQTIGWVSNNTSVIASPANSEEGDSVTVTTGSVVAQTTVRLTGTVVSPGSATNYIDIIVKPARTMSSIALHGTIEKDTYFVGDTWDLTGLDIQVNWSDGDPTFVALTDVAVVYACSPETATNSSVTSFELEVIYADFDEVFTVEDLTVSEHPLADIIDGTTIPAAAIGSGTSSWGVASTFSDYTDAVYTARFMGPGSNSYIGRLNDSVNGYIYTSSLPTGLRLKSVSIEAIASSKSVCVFAQNTAFDSAPSAKGDAIATLTPENLSYTFTDSYKAICIRGAASACDIGKVTIEYESAAPVMEYTAGGTTSNLTVINGSTNSVTFNTDNFDSVTVGLFSNTPTNSNSTKANLSYSVSGTVVTVTATGKAVGEESFTISATGCSNSLTLNVTVQASTTFDSLVISTATSATEFNEDDAFAVTDMVVTANFTVGGSPTTETFADSGEPTHPLTALSFTLGGNAIDIGDPITTSGNSLTVGVSYTDGATGTTRSTSYTIKVNAYVAHTWTKVTSAPADWRGTYLLGYEKDGTFYSFNSGLATFDATFNTVNTTSVSAGVVTGSKELDATAVKIERNTVSGTSYYHAKCANGEYLKAASKGINHQQTATAAVAITFDGVSLKIGDYWLRFNTANDQLRFRFGDSSYLSSSTASLYKMDVTSAVNTEVSNFVSGFDSAIGGVCDDDGININVSSLNSAWTSQANAFKSLSVDAQGILANTTYTHDSETAGSIKDIVDRYDYVYGKYSVSLTKGDFMNRSDAGTLVSYSSTRISPITSGNNAIVMIISITSAITLTAVGAYFLLRKRKEH